MTVVSLPRYAPSRVLTDLIPGDAVRDLALVLATAGFIGLSAQVSVPIPGTPIPVTLQTFAMLLAGAALGWRRGVAGIALYVAAGSLGVPWFSAHHAGFGGASFGYLLSYLLAAPLVGWLASRGGDRTPLRTVATMLAGTAVVYLIGVPWLMGSAHLGLGAAVAAGVTPFLLGDALKVLAAAGLLPGTWALVRRFRP